MTYSISYKANGFPLNKRQLTTNLFKQINSTLSTVAKTKKLCKNIRVETLGLHKSGKWYRKICRKLGEKVKTSGTILRKWKELRNIWLLFSLALHATSHILGNQWSEGSWGIGPGLHSQICLITLKDPSLKEDQCWKIWMEEWSKISAAFYTLLRAMGNIWYW